MKQTITLVLLLLGIELYSQVSASPPIVILDPISKTGTMTLQNSGSIDKEVEISFKFGYGKVDETGKYSLIYDDSATAEKYSIANSLISFPKKLLLPAKSEQTVRILAKNTNTLSDGTYWTRIIISSKDKAKQIDTNTKTDKITVGFQIITESINLLFLRKGNVSMDIEPYTMKLQTDSSQLHLNVVCKSIGNSPFLGSAILTIYNSEGEGIDVKDMRAAVYLENNIIFSFDKDKFKPGKYRAEVNFNNKRDDIPPENRIKFEPKTRDFEFQIN